jgi:hypothetical protein
MPDEDRSPCTELFQLRIEVAIGEEDEQTQTGSEGSMISTWHPLSKCCQHEDGE